MYYYVRYKELKFRSKFQPPQQRKKKQKICHNAKIIFWSKAAKGMSQKSMKWNKNVIARNYKITSYHLAIK